jgi:LacI family transcriptional regulator
MRSSVTVQDVAKRAGVSTATVSRVLNGYPFVSEAARGRVRRAVDELNYQPSRLARQLRVGSTQMLGLLISDIANPFSSSVTRGVEDYAWERGYSLILCDSDEDPVREERSLNTFLAQRVDGVIASPISEESRAGWDALIDHGIPIVAMDRRLRGMPVDMVLADNISGARQAVELLLDLGHRRIGLVGGPPYVSTARERQFGYEQALTGRGLPVDTVLIRTGDMRQPSGRIAAEELLSLQPRPTALFCFNNLMTLGALEAIRARRLRIPDDLSVIGFDDMPWATILDPPLTAVAQPAYELGRTAAELLLRRVADPSLAPSEIRLPTRLVVRASCGPAPQSE